MSSRAAPTSLLVAQFFLFPLIIIAICVGIFVLFGYLIYEQRGPNEYLTDIQTGPDGHLYVVSTNRGTIYEIFPR